MTLLVLEILCLLELLGVLQALESQPNQMVPVDLVPPRHLKLLHLQLVLVVLVVLQYQDHLQDLRYLVVLDCLEDRLILLVLVLPAVQLALRLH